MGARKGETSIPNSDLSATSLSFYHIARSDDNRKIKKTTLSSERQMHPAIKVHHMGQQLEVPDKSKNETF